MICLNISESAATLRDWSRRIATVRALGQLKAMVDDAAAAGKDLVRDMVGRLKRDILIATNRLDAIRQPH
jgi:hypothetical protein